MSISVLNPLPSLTYFIGVSNGKQPIINIETEDGFAWSAALDWIWQEQHPEPRRLLAQDLRRGTVDDVTLVAAEALAKRTFERGETPHAVRYFCEPLGCGLFEPERAAYSALGTGWGLSGPGGEHRLGARQLGVGRWA